jgi:hypothetical protein
MDRAKFQRWIAQYERAWRSPGTEALADLFAEEASYGTAPFEKPFVGLAAIAQLWDEEREGPDEVFSMESELIAVEGDTGVARIEVAYGDPVARRYRDLWIIRLDGEGLCREFEEWPFWPSEDEGTYRPGPGESDR